MADREEKSQTVILGKQMISGTKSTSGVYKNPKAEVEIYNKNLKINLEKNITKLILKVLFEYAEATTKKDLPNFLFSLKQNGKEINRAFWSDPDVFYKFEEHHGELIIEIDLEKFYSDEEKIKLDFSAHLECWLEESSWRGGTPQKTAAASSDADLEINLPKIQEPGAAPEIELKISPTHSPGKDLKNYVNADWGQPCFLKVHLENKSNNTLTSGNFTLFENNKNIKDATLKKELESKWKTIIISEDNATWVMIKDWKWYEAAGSGKFRLKNKINKTYEYYSNGKTIDEFGFTFDLESNKISVNVRPPDYKINAMNAYNLAVDLKSAGDILAALLAGEAALIIGPGVLLSGAAGFLYGLGSSSLTAEEAEEVKKELKNVMDDPPKFDRNYTVVFLPKLKIRKKTTHKNKIIRNYLLSAKSFVIFSRAARVSNDRAFSAKSKRDKLSTKKQFAAARKYKKQMLRNLFKFSKSHILFGREINKINKKIKNQKLSKALAVLAKLHKKFGSQINILVMSLK